MTTTERFALAPISQLIGFEVVPAMESDRIEGRATLHLDTDQRFHNPMGRVHGGIIATLADAAMGIAFGRTLENGQDFSTIDLQIQYMRPVIARRLTAQGKVIQRGLRIGFVECMIEDDQGRMIAKASCSCTIVA